MFRLDRNCVTPPGYDYYFEKYRIEQAVDIKYTIAMLNDEIESYQKLGAEDLIQEADRRKDDLNKSLKDICQLLHDNGPSPGAIEREINECSEALNIISDYLLQKFLIDTHYCDALGEIILKLANIEEKPKYCHSSHNLTTIADSDIKPEIKHTPKNSVFFKLGLSESNSIIKLKTFLAKNHVDFHDYTDKVISQNSDKAAKLICIISRGLLRTLYPKVLEYFDKNPSEIDRYRKITLKKYTEIITDLKSQLPVSNSQNRTELLKKIDDFNVGCPKTP